MTRLDNFDRKALREGFSDEKASTIIKDVGKSIVIGGTYAKDVFADSRDGIEASLEMAAYFLDYCEGHECGRFLGSVFVEMLVDNRPYALFTGPIEKHPSKKLLDKHVNTGYLRILPPEDDQSENNKVCLIVPTDKLLNELELDGWGSFEEAEKKTDPIGSPYDVLLSRAARFSLLDYYRSHHEKGYNYN
jgi:hypothetical protein